MVREYTNYFPGYFSESFDLNMSHAKIAWSAKYSNRAIAQVYLVGHNGCDNEYSWGQFDAAHPFNVKRYAEAGTVCDPTDPHMTPRKRTWAAAAQACMAVDPSKVDPRGLPRIAALEAAIEACAEAMHTEASQGLEDNQILKFWVGIELIETNILVEVEEEVP
jgi:hypothetical protein